jgi:hypothetical protein
LAGFARHPGGEDLTFSKALFCELLQSIEGRGRHATGVAACGGSNPFVWKWAEPVSKVLKSDPWPEVLGAISDDTPIFLGHTRHATHSNAKEDAAAHPFREGRVTGAHNGIIYNWQTIAKEFKRDTGENRLIVDSQAAFVLLDHAKNPGDALKELEGYFALTWSRAGRLFMARTSDAPLAVAYIPELRALYWNSEERLLKNVLGAAGVKDAEYNLWNLTPGSIYEFTPSNFDNKASGVVKHEKAFDAQPRKKLPAFNSARPQMWDDKEWWDRGGYAGGKGDIKKDDKKEDAVGKRGRGRGKPRVRVGYSDGSEWDPVRATQSAGRAKLGSLSLRDLADELEAIRGGLLKRICLLEEENEELRESIARLDAEQEFMFDLLDDNGFLGDAEEDEEEEEDGAEGEEEIVVTDEAVETVGGETVVSGMDLIVYQEPTCKECGKGDDGGTFIENHLGEHIHEDCLWSQLVQRGSVHSGRAN